MPGRRENAVQRLGVILMDKITAIEEAAVQKTTRHICNIIQDYADTSLSKIERQAYSRLLKHIKTKGVHLRVYPENVPGLERLEDLQEVKTKR